MSDKKFSKQLNRVREENESIQGDLNRLKQEYYDSKGKACHFRAMANAAVETAESWEHSVESVKEEYEKANAMLRSNMAWLKEHGLSE